MENLNSIAVSSNALGRDSSLSPEYWISQRSTTRMTDGSTISEFALIGSRGTSQIPSTALVLDTGNADRGLLSLKSLGADSKGRVSHKKVVPEGAVIVSRLRPYLRQITYIPVGTLAKLDVTAILCSTEFYVINPKDQGESIAFMVPWLLSKEVQKILEDATTGGHHPRFDEDLLSRLTIPKSVLEKRQAVSAEVDRLIKSHLDAQLGLAKIVGNVD